MNEQTMILAGIAVIVVVDKVLNILKTRGIDIPRMSRQMDELWRWHAKEDDEGVKVWYVRRSLEDSVKALADNISSQTKVLEEIHREQIALRKEFIQFKKAT